LQRCKTDIESIIPAVAAVQNKTVVIMSVPGPILTDWRQEVPAILTNFLPGEQVGHALVDVLFGIVPPQGKLPITFPKKENEQKMTEHQYPGVFVQGHPRPQVNYSEGQIVGYRWYDKHEIKPAFPFGHGLTYGKFSYSDLKIRGRKITFAVKRESGTGCDTPQVYFGYPAAASDERKPNKVLRYFQKVCADQKMSFEYEDLDVSNWDTTQKRWKVTPGEYTVFVGASSQDIRITGLFIVSSPFIV